MGKDFTIDKAFKWADLILPVRKQIRNWRKAIRKRKTSGVTFVWNAMH